MTGTKISGITTNILNYYFSKKNYNLAHQTKYLHMKKQNLLPIISIFVGLLFSRNANKTRTDQTILQPFLLYLKRNVWRTFKYRSCKKVFPKCVYHWCNLLLWIFFIPCVITENDVFYTSLPWPRSLLQLPCCCTLCSKCFERNLHFMSVISTMIL